MKKLLIILFVLLSFRVFSQENINIKIDKLEDKLDSIKKEKGKILLKIEDLKLLKIRQDIQKIGIPRHTKDEVIINHSAMSLCYDEKYEQAKWVVHIVTPDIIYGNASRSNNFRVDSLIKTGSAEEEDYFLKHLKPDSTYEYDGSGYDRGHLAPSADFRWSKKAVSESFYYSNMSPQRDKLNRERWADLENTIRQYVIESKEQVYVVTGGVLTDGLYTIGKNNVGIPEYFYKIVLDYEGDEKKGIAFIMPNKSCAYPVMSYAVSIDSVEKLTDIDFFPDIPNEQENKIEAHYDIKKWQTKKNKNNISPLNAKELSKGQFNTVQAKSHIDETITVCGTVVATKYSKKGNTFINLDKTFPNQIFTITIWKDNRANFSYKPEEELLNKKICVKGIVKNYKGTPTMEIKNEKDIGQMSD